MSDPLTAAYLALHLAGAPRCGLPRDPDVTYAGLPPRHGFQRDHIIPLCLGGADTAGNVVYESLAEARRKDEWEHRLCRATCAGWVTQTDAVVFFRDEKWK
jgi:hypothetical protein